jgi:hypothetical protein
LVYVDQRALQHSGPGRGLANEFDGRGIQKLVTRKVDCSHMYPEDINGLLAQQSFNRTRDPTGCPYENFAKMEKVALRWLSKRFFSSWRLAEVF